MRTRPARSRLGLSAILATLSAGFAQAQLPENVTRGSANPPSSIEIFHGTRKSEPKPIDLKPTTDSISQMTAQVQAGTAEAWKTSSQFLTRLVERNTPKWESFRSPIVVNVTVPPTVIQQVPVRTEGVIQQTGLSGGTSSATPGYLPWVNASRDITPPPPIPTSPGMTTIVMEPTAREDAKPTVIIIREAAATESNNLVISPWLALITVGGFLFALCCVLLAVVWRMRISANRPFDPLSQRKTTSTVRDGHLAIAGWDAGPLPETTQKFDLGLSYAEQIAQQKLAEVENENAMIQHILQQNLLLQAELNGE